MGKSWFCLSYASGSHLDRVFIVRCKLNNTSFWLNAGFFVNDDGMQFNECVGIMLVSSPVVAVLIGIVLDSTMNSEEEDSRNDSGKKWWQRFIQFTKDIRNAEFYSLPFKLGNFFPSL